MTRLRSLPVLLALFVTPTLVAAQDQTLQIGGRDVDVWRPRGATSGRQPVIIFSHGFGGCGTQSKFLTEGLAERGYWVFAPNHKDARCGPGRGGAMSRPEAPFGNPEEWTDKNYADRRDDVRAIIKVLRDSAALAARVDLNQLGLAGHSLGGYTVLGVAGAWASWKTPGIKAVLALSPYAQPFLAHSTLGGLSAPVMFQGGTLDLGITPWIRKNSGGYDASPTPKYYVEFAGQGHFAWTNLRPEAHDRILQYSLAFLDRYVRNQTSGGAVLTKAGQGVSQLRYHSELGTGEQGSAGRAGRRERSAWTGLVTIDANGDSGPFDVSRLPRQLSLENTSHHRVHSAR
jgi:predicted dienelactone hydrolase